jgi:hypothetical protein
MRGLPFDQEHMADFGQDLALQNAPLLVASRQLGQVLLSVASAARVSV